MAEDKNIRLTDVVKETGVSLSTIHHYIKKGLLPKPKLIPTDSRRGAWAVYSNKFINVIKEIRKRLEDTHSLEEVKKEMENLIPEKKRKEIIHAQAQKLEKLASEGRYGTEEYKKVTDFFNTTTQSSLAIYFHTLENTE